MFALPLSIIICLIPRISSLTLEGLWTLQSIQAQNSSLLTNFSYYIFRNESIMGKMQITGCQLLSYQFTLQDDNIYIDVDSYLVQPVRDCSEAESATSSALQDALRQVLKFMIDKDVLVFMSPSYDPVVNFQYLKNTTYDLWKTSLTGSWIANLVGNSTSYVMVANQSSLSLCAGAVFSLKITSLYNIRVSLQSAGGCKDQTLIQNVSSVAYYRKFDSTLEFYDNGINLIFQAVYNPNGVQNIAQPILAAPSSSSGSSNATSPASSSGLPAGKYFILLLYNRSLGRLPILITPTTFTIQLCSQLLFNYTLAGNSSLAVQSNQSPVTNCAKGNEALFFNTLMQSVKYRMDSEGVITLLDSSGKSIVSLSQ